jgi:hypothetical protein
MQSLRIDLNKLTGARAFTAKDGVEFIAIPVRANSIYVGQTGAHYLDVTLIENRDGEDKYGNDGFAAVNLPKERREAGEKGPIIGNWKHVKARKQVTPPEPAVEDDGSYPF